MFRVEHSPFWHVPLRIFHLKYSFFECGRDSHNFEANRRVYNPDFTERQIPNRMNQVQLRPATLDDMEMIFHWRNDPFILQRSTSPNPIRWEEHQSWFRRALSSPNYCLLIVQVDGTPIGQVRFDRKGAIAIISVYVVEQYTRKGHGVAAIEQATGQIFRIWRLRAVVACIREDNHPAQSAFARAGYAENGDMRTFCAPGHVTYAANAPAATS